MSTSIITVWYQLVKLGVSLNYVGPPELQWMHNVLCSFSSDGCTLKQTAKTLHIILFIHRSGDINAEWLN